VRDLGAAVLNGKVYLMGGLDQSAPSDSAIPTVFSYDLAADVWSKRADMESSRFSPAATVLNDNLYVLGGYTNANQSADTITALASVEQYDPTDDVWTYRSDMNQSRWGFQAVALNGKIYAFGGVTTGGVPVSSVEEYDPQVDSWSWKADMPVQRTSFGAIALNGKIYLIGGYTSDSSHEYVAEVHAYDPTSDSWTTNAPIPTPRETPAVVEVNHKIWAIGGTAASGIVTLATIEEFDPVKNSWITKPDLPSPRNVCYGAAFGNWLYVLGGYNDWTMQAAYVPPVLNICQAIQLNFQTETGQVYQLQASPDLSTWTNFDSPILGDGSVWSKFYLTHEQSELFFRFTNPP
jgi:N-acetylneuraminic acid mutarotase